MIRVMYNNLFFEAIKYHNNYILYRPGYVVADVDIRDCVPLLDIHDVSYDVFENIIIYFENNLQEYTIKRVYRASEHPDDKYLYMVIAYNNKMNTYSCWTCWNNSSKSLNYGHYNIESLEDCVTILMERYNRLYFD